MARATWVSAAIAVIAVAVSAWLYLDNRDLREQLEVTKASAAEKTTDSDKLVAVRGSDPSKNGTPSQSDAKGFGTGPSPKLPEQKDETRLEKRQRRMSEFAAQFGRSDGETEEEYRNRVMPMIAAGLMVPRARVDEMRRQAEEKAGVTADQSKRLDKAFEKVYADAIDYTNKAVADGLLSPYERNVSGWLDYAGGLGGILTDANGQIGQILTPQQMAAMKSSGFEWGEYFAASAPWEKLNPPPPPR